MAATDQNYRNQYTLDIVFAISSVLMLVFLIGMYAQEHNREYKTEQRHFRDVETALAQRMALESLPDSVEIDVAEDKVEKEKEARKKQEAQLKALNDQVAALRPSKETSEQSFGAVKADLESRTSFYYIEVEDHGPDSSLAKQYLKEITDLNARLAEAKLKRDDIANQMRDLQVKVDEIEKPLTDAQGNLKKVNDRFDTLVRLSISKQWRLGDTVRGLPILDAFAPPVKIHQFTLNDVPIDYNFKYVTRFDRCMTCHLGIDRPAYTRDKLQTLTEPSDQLEYNLKSAQAMMKKRRDVLSGLPEHAQTLDPKQLQLTVLAKDMLNPARITQFAAHPRLDLFVGADSKHPAERFGCSSCHSGQGSSTSFVLAAHTPNNSKTREKWEKDHHWEAQHMWDFPMLPQRFVESGCLKCHHQVTDLITTDNRVEAPKLLRGFNLIKENGCFGCHEIAGRKGGRPIGPDLRLEPNPPLEDLTPAEQAKALSDPDNPPGTLRKVGPSLFRLTEKTNADWTTRWLAAPRSFRPDTKMPHFYNTSNNNKEALAGSGQEDFPDTEMHAVSHYLFAASQEYLDELKLYQDPKKDGSPAERQRDAELQSFLQTFVDTKAALTKDRFETLKKLLPAGFGKGKQRWERRSALTEQDLAKWQDLLKTYGGTLPSDPNKDVTRLIEIELKEVARRNNLRTMPPPLAQTPDPLQGHTPNPSRGRQLFSERGCLACHTHQGTETKQGTAGQKDFAPAMHSEALFGPNLSQVKAKLGSKPGDKKSAQRWLVQWLLDPNVHSPRTRMPVTFLAPAEAADIAGWLLDQEPRDLGADWQEINPEKPSKEKLQKLAEVYLTRLLPKDMIKRLWEKGTEEVDAGARSELGVAERDLVDDPTEQGLLHYVGRKAVGRLGCYACHDVPGYENAKPIGTGLNEWGKKDPERLAFEDIKKYVTNHFNIVDSLVKDGKPVQADSQKRPAYEKFFADSLFHHGREGFLNQKLFDPRSYDYQRKLPWDERSRMPQFRFARLTPNAKEPAAEFEARANLEEARAREAVATFVLGLTGEQVPLISINHPAGARASVVKGRQILEKFNCAGCHLIQPGVVEFKNEPRILEELDSKAMRDKLTHYFPDHYFFTGKDPTFPDKLVAHVANPKLLINEDDPTDRKATFTLSQALRFRGSDRSLKDIKSATNLTLDPQDMLTPPPHAWASPEALRNYLAEKGGPYGGAFAQLLAEYLVAKDKASPTPLYKADVTGKNPGDEARSASPPPLFGQGERTQPDWLYQFLLNPTQIRKMTELTFTFKDKDKDGKVTDTVLKTTLRMPRFNMSKEEARTLVEYFSSLERINNPGIGLTAPFETIKQQEDSQAFWVAKTQDYIKRLDQPADKGGATWKQKRLEELEPLWKQIEADFKTHQAEAKKQLAAADAKVKDAKGELDKADAERIAASWQAEVDMLAKNADRMTVQRQKKDWEEKDAYLVDSYRLLFNRDLCAKCHQTGPQEINAQVQGPPLTLAHQRLRPGFLQRWIAGPQAYLPYGSVMPNNFPADQAGKHYNLFVGTPLEQITAARDVLLNYPRAESLPVNRRWVLPSLNPK